MAYPQAGNHLAYMVPNITLAQNAAEVLKEIDIGAASGDHGEFICVRNCQVKRIAFTLSGEAASGTTTAPTVIFTKRPTPLSATGEAVMGAVTVASGGAIGNTYYKDLSSPVSLSVGDSVEISWTVGVGTPTGMGFAWMVCEDDPEYIGNLSDVIASA